MRYYFILGKNPTLSKAEIEATLESKALKSQVLKSWDKILFLDTEKDLDINWLNSRLGGTVKIGKILDKINDLEQFEDKFFNLIKFGEGKAYFGFSLYALNSKINLAKKQKQMNAIAMDIKRILREEKNINSRYVASKEPELSSVIVKKNKLLQNGAEICFFLDQDEILIGQTLAVQPFEEFGARDFTRPSRDDLAGMLPPKLARIMVNLAQMPLNSVILDPFCGSGTILQEALLLGYENLTASDNSDKAIASAKANLDWLINKYNLQAKNLKISKADAQKLSANLPANSIDGIITEPYLGPALSGNETASQINEIIRRLEDLYIQALAEFAKILKPKGKIVMVMPIFKLKDSEQRLEISKQIQKLGFANKNKEELIYSRPNQFIWREILIWEKI